MDEIKEVFTRLYAKYTNLNNGARIMKLPQFIKFLKDAKILKERVEEKSKKQENSPAKRMRVKQRLKGQFRLTREEVTIIYHKCRGNKDSSILLGQFLKAL